ncbi:MAG: hypothetical protein ACLVAV_13965 [Clostridium sp.]
MRTRRTVALGLSAVMAVSVLSGCGSSSSSTTADTKGGKQCIRRKLHRAGRTSLVGILCREYGSRTGM